MATSKITININNIKKLNIMRNPMFESEDNDDYGGCMDDFKNFRGNIVIEHPVMPKMVSK